MFVSILQFNLTSSLPVVAELVEVGEVMNAKGSATIQDGNKLNQTEMMINCVHQEERAFFETRIPVVKYIRLQ